MILLSDAEAKILLRLMDDTAEVLSLNTMLATPPTINLGVWLDLKETVEIVRLYDEWAMERDQDMVPDTYEVTKWKLLDALAAAMRKRLTKRVIS